MLIEQTRAVMTAYLEGHMADALADDAVFTIMGTGDVANGRDAIGRMLRDLYETAFDARADLKNLVVGEDHAVAEYEFAGRHVGEFAGRAASGATVKVPFCVVYEVSAGKIAAARVYFEMSALLRQIEAARAG